MKLVPTAANPVPEGAIVSRVVTRDGAPLRVARWPGATHPVRAHHTRRGISQGRAGSLEKYFRADRGPLRAALWVVAFDWRGRAARGGR